MSIRILGHDYDIKIDVSEWKEGQPAHIDFGDEVICVQAGLSESRAKSCILHEIVEAINTEFELKLDHNVLSSIDAGLYQVIADNPDVFTFKLPKK